MPRSVEFLEGRFGDAADAALRFVELLERNRDEFSVGASVIDRFSVEIAYELAFLRLFGSWESFLEEIFVRLLCGYERSGGDQEPLKAGESYSNKIGHAETRMLNGRRYVSWYVPSDIVGRCRGFFSHGNLEAVIASATVVLEDQRVVRHQIAHVQKHASSMFDSTTMRLVGRRFPASSAGRFLRSDANPGVRWLEHFAVQLKGLAHQIVT